MEENTSSCVYWQDIPIVIGDWLNDDEWIAACKDKEVILHIVNIENYQ